MVAQGFVHPGLLHTEEDFERIREQLDDGHPAVVQAYENLKANEWSQSDVATWPVETIKRGIAGDENYMNAARGAAAAYQNALRWKISGEQAHADRAVFILNAWAETCTGIHGNTNMSLASGIYGYQFANAAELMRDYDGWDPAAFKKFQEFMMRVFYPTALDFLTRRHDTWERGFPGHYWANWGLCNALTVMSIGVLCDDVFVYNQGVSYYKYDLVGSFNENRTSPVENDGLNEFLGNLVPILYEDERGPFGYLGQCQESGRDQGHSTMAVGLAVDIAQTGWNQGDDLFAHMDNRLAAGLEYVAAYNSGIDDLPWAEYRYRSVGTAAHLAWVQTWNNEHARGQFRPYWDRVIGHYTGIKGISMPFSEAMRNKVVADAGGSGGTSGGYDHLGYSTLTSTRPAATPERAPTTLQTSIVYKGSNIPRGELMHVEPGTTVKFVPALPDGEVDTGNWTWSTGEAGKDLELVADSSGLYRVKYVNASGVASTQLFSIAVNLHINVEPVGPAYSIADGPVENNAHVRVLAGQSVALMPVLKSGWEGGSWMWSDGSKEETLVLEQIGEAREVSVVYTLNGEDFELTYRISVLPFEGAFGYWPMDEAEGSVVNDVWAGNNAEKLVGGWTNGIAQGGIFLMDAASSYLQFPTGFIRPLREFSISIWVKPAALEGWARAWDFGRGTDFNMFLTLSAEGNDRPCRFAIKAGGAEEQINTTQVLELGKWSHLTITRSGNMGLMYLNGKEVGRNSNMTLFPADLGLTNQNYVGKSQWPDPMFNGVVDELRIYSKALSPNEVMALTNLVVPETPVHLPAYREGGPQSKLREDAWTIWPNPVATDLRIAPAPDLAHGLEIGVFDSRGTRLALVTKQEEDSYVVEMGGLPAGVYFVAVQYGSRRFVNKVVKVN